MLYRMTILAIEQELNKNDKSIADTWSLTDEHFDVDTLLATIINRGASFEPLYTDPDYFYLHCSYFWKRWQKTFDDWFSAMYTDYNWPDNYDRIENWTDSTTENINETTNDDTSNSRTLASTEVIDGETTSNTTGTTSNTTDNDVTSTDSVSAFDSSNFSNRGKNVTTNDTTESGSSSDSNTSTNDTTTTENANESNTGSFDREFEGVRENETEHEGRIRGNIGVTSTMELLERQLKIRSWNLYNHMADVFLKELTLTVY